MDPISNADRLVLLLRQKLQERNKTRRGVTRGAPAPSGVRALGRIEGIEEAPLRRALIQSLLADQLGPALINDAQFQQVVTRVSEAIDDDAQTRALLSRVIADLRAGQD